MGAVEAATTGDESGNVFTGPAGTSNRTFEKTYGSGVIPSSKGVDTVELLDNARAAIRSGNFNPYSILSWRRSLLLARVCAYALHIPFRRWASLLQNTKSPVEGFQVSPFASNGPPVYT